MCLSYGNTMRGFASYELCRKRTPHELNISKVSFLLDSQLDIEPKKNKQCQGYEKAQSFLCRGFLKVVDGNATQTIENT